MTERLRSIFDGRSAYGDVPVLDTPLPLEEVVLLMKTPLVKVAVSIPKNELKVSTPPLSFPPSLSPLL
jgi:hypothetical protein